MNRDKDRLIEFLSATHTETDDYKEQARLHDEYIADYLLANGVIVLPFEVGEEIWVIDREDGEAVDISCVMFLAKSKGCIIATSWINDYDLDETLEYHINETQNNFDTDLKVYPDEACFATKEEAETELRKRSEDNA